MFKTSVEIKYNIKLYTILSNVLFVSALLLPKNIIKSNNSEINFIIRKLYL